MALIQAYNPSSGGGPGTDVAGQRDVQTTSSPFASGYAIPLSETPIDESTIIVYSEGLVLYPTDWNYNSGTNEVEILFGANPATDSQSGTWHFFVQYLYQS